MKPTKQLSALQRQQNINYTQNTLFDLVVIGGGITGAGIAFDAASRGLKVALFEMQDFAAGTSSRSTKLIHGGLRYLKQLEVNLVREVGKERAILHHNAPHLVRPKKMLLPIIENGSLGKYSSSFGLYVYDWLAGVDKTERRSMHNKSDTLALEPLLRDDIVVGGGLYYEYQTDDARLCIEVLKTAAKYGATALNYTEVISYTYDKEGIVNGVQLVDRLKQQAFTVKTKKVVNATGPWVDKLRQKDQSVKGKRLHLTKGVHIVVPYHKLPLQQACYFDVQDGRMIFAIPRADTTYIGTTDTNYTDDIIRPEITQNDAQYIIEATNCIFPSVKLTISDIISSWAGLRPLIHEDGKSPSELSRKDEIFYAESGLISIAGGKLTGFRKMAERVVNVVIKQLYIETDRPVDYCVTDTIKIGGGNFKKTEDVQEFIWDLSEEYAPLTISKTQLENLVYKYGRYTTDILDFFEKETSNKLSITERLLKAELQYAVKNEMVHTLSDFTIRRTGRLYFERPQLDNIVFFLLDELADILALTKQEKLKQYSEFEKEYKAVLQFKQTANS